MPGRRDVLEVADHFWLQLGSMRAVSLLQNRRVFAACWWSCEVDHHADTCFHVVCQAVGAAMASGTKGALATSAERCTSQLNDVVQLVRGELSNLNR